MSAPHVAGRSCLDEGAGGRVELHVRTDWRRDGGANRLQREDVMLIVFGGLPGTGKTTISRVVATHRFATHLRIDAIEQAIRNAGVLAGDVGTAGYGVANALAETNLADGRMVVVDGVHPVAECREAWEAIASRLGTRLIAVEVVCSDRLQHRRRVEGRVSDIRGLVLPTWQAVLERGYEPWKEPHLIIDTLG
jgi:predicted kinase